MNIKFIASLVCSCLLVFSSCKKEDPDEVKDSWITIIHPGFLNPNPEADNVSVLVVYSTTTGNLLEVRARVFPKNNRNNVVYSLKDKINDSRYTLTESLNLSNFSAGTVFTLIAETDQNKKGTLVAMDSVEFTIR